MCVQALVTKATIERLYERIIGRLKSSVTPFSYAQRSSAFEINSWPLSTRMIRDAPRVDKIRVIAATTCSPFMP
jgi:hypothetical protein